MRFSRKCIGFLVSSLVSLTLLVPSAPATAEVTELGWPYPPTNLEAYSARVAPSCDPTNKPGPQRLLELLSFWFGPPDQFNPNWHIARPCSVSPTSYHREGRDTYWLYPSGYGPLRHVRSITGPLGNCTAQAALASSPWRVWTALGPTTLTVISPVSAAYGARAFRGACTVTL